MLKSRTAFLFVVALLALAPSQTAVAQYVKEDSTRPAQPERGAQESQNQLSDETFWNRISFGGNMGGWFGNPTFLELSPVATYAFTERFMAGPGITYIYYSERNRSTGYRFTSTVYGGRLLSRYLITDNIFAQAELEGLSLPYAVRTTERRRFWVVSPLIGGGMRAPLGRRGGVFVTILYNPIYRPDRSPYASPFIFRVGFGL